MTTCQMSNFEEEGLKTVLKITEVWGMLQRVGKISFWQYNGRWNFVLARAK